jgi:hypothetical protein
LEAITVTRRFVALLQIAVIFAAAGIPVAILWALYDAWRLLPTLGDGIGYWSLAIGFAMGSFGVFVSILGVVGLLFGLLVTTLPPATVTHRPVKTAVWLGVIAGLIGGIGAYHFGRWGAGEAAAAWWAGALAMGGVCAVTCGGLAALYFRVALRAGELGATPSHSELPRG